MNSQCYVVLTDVSGDREISVAKYLAHLLQVGLKQARVIVKSLPQVVLEQISTAEAEVFKQNLEELGATVNVKYYDSESINTSAENNSQLSLESYYSTIVSINDDWEKLEVIDQKLAELEESGDKILSLSDFPEVASWQKELAERENELTKNSQDIEGLNKRLESLAQKYKTLTKEQLIHLATLIILAFIALISAAYTVGVTRRLSSGINVLILGIIILLVVALLPSKIDK